jgi:hypothetical protein
MSKIAILGEICSVFARRRSLYFYVINYRVVWDDGNLRNPRRHNQRDLNKINNPNKRIN